MREKVGCESKLKTLSFIGVLNDCLEMTKAFLPATGALEVRICIMHA